MRATRRPAAPAARTPRTPRWASAAPRLPTPLRRSQRMAPATTKVATWTTRPTALPCSATSVTSLWMVRHLIALLPSPSYAQRRCSVRRYLHHLVLVHAQLLHGRGGHGLLGDAVQRGRTILRRGARRWLRAAGGLDRPPLPRRHPSRRAQWHRASPHHAGRPRPDGADRSGGGHGGYARPLRRARDQVVGALRSGRRRGHGNTQSLACARPMLKPAPPFISGRAIPRRHTRARVRLREIRCVKAAVVAACWR